MIGQTSVQNIISQNVGEHFLSIIERERDLLNINMHRNRSKTPTSGLYMDTFVGELGVFMRRYHWTIMTSRVSFLCESRERSTAIQLP